jgi:hypothetical protein
MLQDDIDVFLVFLCMIELDHVRVIEQSHDLQPSVACEWDQKKRGEKKKRVYFYFLIDKRSFVFRQTGFWNDFNSHGALGLHIRAQSDLKPAA